MHWPRHFVHTEGVLREPLRLAPFGGEIFFVLIFNVKTKFYTFKI